MTEYIKRDDALQAVTDCWEKDFGCRHAGDIIRSPYYAIFDIPAEDVVERKTGKWIDYTEDGFVECPFCHSATNCDGEISELHYCFNCGAQMIGGDEDA